MLEERYRMHMACWDFEIFLRQSLVFTMHFERPIKARITHCCTVNIKYFSVSSKPINTEEA